VRGADGGRHWHPTAARGTGWQSDILSLTADPDVRAQLSKRANANSVTGAVYKTTDGGQHWTRVFAGFGVYKVAVDPARPATIWAIGAVWSRPNGNERDTFFIMRSTDGGHTWASAP
jgi:photosystem II stability/assembly factor-like uncharacterized protein